MGLTTGNFPPVEPATFTHTPYRERMRTLGRNRAEYGFGAPKIIALIYIVKLLFFYVLGGVLVATLASGLDPLRIQPRGGTSRSSTRRPSSGPSCSSACISRGRGARCRGTSSR